MTIANSVVAKASVAFVALAMMFTLVAPAQAQTVEELQAEIAALMAQINGLQADMGGDMSSSSVCPYTWTRSLNMGDTGMDVMKLQQFLNADPATQVAVSGAGAPGAETEYYGPATGAAVAKFQEMYRAEILSPLGLVNSTTFFGPSTMAQANAVCVASDDGDDDMGGDDSDDSDDSSDDSDSLGNDEGSIESVSSASADESTLEEGQTGGVLAFEVEIEGDVEINRVDVYAAEDGAASEDAEDYFVEASLWVDGDKVATLDVDDFHQDDHNVLGLAGDDYRLRFSSLDLVFSDGDEPEFQVAFEVVNNLDSADLATDWDVEVDSIRYVDGQGFTDSEDSIGVADTFDFDEEEMAELDISESTDNPDSTTLKIDDGDDESDEFTVFIFEIEEENGVDVNVDEMTLTITTTGNVNEGEVVDEAILYHGSTELASENVNNGGVVVFENLDVDIAGDATEEFSLGLIFNGSDDAGTTTDVTVAFTSLDEAEDANGNDEGDMTITGTPSSETHDLRTVVPEVSDTSFEVDRNEAGDAGTISFTFTVGAEDDDYAFGIADKNDVDGATDDILFTITGGDLGANATASIAKISGDATSTGSGWTVADGDEATFVLDVVFAAASASGAYRVNVESVGGIEVDETSGSLNI